MTKLELITALNKFDNDYIVIISDSEGWSNIETVKLEGSSIAITIEEHPVFSDN